MGEALVLCYHAVSEDWPAPLAVAPDSLERQLELLIRRGYQGVTFSEAVGSSTNRRNLAVTFDDAYLSVLEGARPILDRLGLPGTVFVPTDFPDRPEEPMGWPGVDHWLGGPHRAELRPLSWKQLGELAAAGWEVGSHTVSHPRLPTLDDAELDAELGRSRAQCEQRLGIACRTVAYPYGAWNARVSAAAERAGYEAAGTLLARVHRQRDPGAERALPLGWPRIGIYRGDDMRRFRLKVSPAVRLLRSSRWKGRRRAVARPASPTTASP
jgi:peptidoglycan/xylan/chitin deacetylase (PgdA/CDA1 family)